VQGILGQSQATSNANVAWEQLVLVHTSETEAQARCNHELVWERIRSNVRNCYGGANIAMHRSALALW
jgi:hypothetical protein